MVKQIAYDVFLSYNNTDKPAVKELARLLVQANIRPWFDEWDVIPGDLWQEAAEKGLNNSATCVIFIGQSGTGPWQEEEMRAAIQRRVDNRRTGKVPFRVIPVLLPYAERGKRSHLPSFLVNATWVEFDSTLDDKNAFHRLISGIRGIEPGPSLDQAIYEGKTPYQGLRFFDVEHAPFFFGREALTEWLLNELRPSPHSTLKQDNRFLGIVGPSGSGKSSLARAGLMAALEKNKIEGSTKWLRTICRPGSDPLESLATALGKATGLSQHPSAVRDLIKDMHDDERMLHLTTRFALHDSPPEQRLVLSVDQFEEIFTLCSQESLRQAFLNNLLYAANVTQGQTVVVLALRADFYGKCAAYTGLAVALSDHQILVGPMETDELRRAIERPAQLAGGEFEAGLVDTLLREVQNQPGSLPLLQDALLELWEQRQGRRLTYETYNKIGRIEGALERRAETVYNYFTDSEKKICRRIFLRLTQPGEGTEDTKRRAPLQELLPIKGDREKVEAVVQQLASAEARLVTIQADKELKEKQFVEVAHEALIQGWTRLREWIEQDRTALRTHRRLTEAAVEWEKNNYDESYLYRGLRLIEVKDWIQTHANELNELERAFLDASQMAVDEAEQEKKAAHQTLEELARRIEEFREVSKFQQKVSSVSTLEQTLQELYDTVTEAMSELLDTRYMYIALYDEDTRIIEFPLAYEQGRRVPEEYRATGGRWSPRRFGEYGDLTDWVIRHKSPLLIEKEFDAWIATQEDIKVFPLGMKCWLGAPMWWRDKIIGVIGLQNFEQEGVFDRNHQDLLMTIASQIAITIGNARLFQLTNQVATERKRRLELLQQISERMARASLDPNTVLELVAQTANDVSGSDLTSIYRYDQESISFTSGVQVLQQGSVERLESNALPSIEGLPAHIAETQAPIFAEQVEKYPEILPFATTHQLRAFAGLPLTIAGVRGIQVTVGVLFVNFKQPHFFSEDEQEILRHLANQAAVAIAYAGAQASALAKEQLATLGTAAATLQHRLGNTISIIFPAVMRLRRRVGSDSTNQDILDTIERNALFTTEVMRRMQLPLHFESFIRTNINSLLLDAIQKCLQDTPRFPQVQLTTNLFDLGRDDLASFAASGPQINLMAHLDEQVLETYGSSGQLTEVFRVLIENAIKAIYPQAGLVTITSALNSNGLRQFIEITVHDTGRGIDEKIRPRLFTQPVPHKEFGQGAGLGLWLSNIIIRSHQGSIRLQDTELGKGSTFLVRLPLLNQPPAGYPAEKGAVL